MELTESNKNIKIGHTTKDAIPDKTTIFQEMDLLLQEKKLYMTLYFNFDPQQLRDLKLDRFLEKKSNDNRVFHILHKSKLTEKRFHSIVFRSMSIPYSINHLNMNDNRFNYLQKYFYFNKEYVINENGFIVIYCNNPNGYYQKWIDYENQLPKLIINIRKFNNKNKIVLRFHIKHRKYLIKNLMNKLKLIDENIDIDNSEFKNTIKQSYCIFIQNASIILDYTNAGIPLFNPGIIPFDDYQGCYNNFMFIENLNKYKDYLINRKRFLIETYNYILFDEEYRRNKDYVKNVYLNNIYYIEHKDK